MEEEEEVFESQMLRWITPEETLEDLVSRVARTTIKLKTSLPFMEEEEDASNKGQSQSQSQGRRARQRIKLRAGHVLELSGSNDTCKTECLLQAAATCILPQACGGCSSKVLFIDMISGLDPLRLVQILDARIRKSAAAKKASGSSLLEESLRRFQLVRCYSSLDLVCALKAISKKARQTEGQENESENLRLILVDNITAFYWTEKSFNGVQSVKTFDFTRREQRTDSSVSYSFRSVYECIALNLQKAARDLSSAVIVTKNLQVNPSKKSAGGPSPGGDRQSVGAILPKAWQDVVNYRVILNKGSERRNAYCALWDLPRSDKVFHFAVRDDSLEIIDH